MAELTELEKIHLKWARDKVVQMELEIGRLRQDIELCRQQRSLAKLTIRELEDKSR